MFGSKAKAFLDAFYVLFFSFMGPSVGYAVMINSDWKSHGFYASLDAAVALGIVAVCIAGIYKLLDAIAPSFKTAKKFSHNAFGLVVLPLLILLCSAVYLILYTIVYNDHVVTVFKGHYIKVWFSCTFIGAVASIGLFIASVAYFKNGSKKDLLL